MLNDFAFLLPVALFALTAFALSGGLTALLRGILLKRQMLDLPNERSLHTVPVPRGGGLAVMAVVAVGTALLAFFPPISTPLVLIILALLLLVLVSWFDDRKGLGAGLRLIAHLLAASIGCLAFTPEQTLFGGHLPLALDRAVMILGWAWFMNLYNFMDGINGITGTETISIMAGVALLTSLLPSSDPNTLILCGLIAGACGGFLLLNWHPAKIFLGDVGSIPLGFLTGYLLLTLATANQLAAALCVALYYLADSGLTITKRLLRGEKIWQAHRQHFYQRAAQAIGRHDKIVLWIMLANLALIDAALVAMISPLLGLGLAVIVVALLLGAMQRAARPPRTASAAPEVP